MNPLLSLPPATLLADLDLVALGVEAAPLHVNAGRVLIVLFLVLLNGFFVAAEFAIVKVRPSQLDTLIDAGDRRAVLAKKITGRLDAYLSATQLGITLASIALGVVAEPFFAAILAPLFSAAGIGSVAVIRSVSLGISFAVVTYLHVVLGELMPKSLAIRKALETSLFVARPLEVFHWIFQPAIWAFNGTANALLRWVFRIDPVNEPDSSHTEDELKILVHESERSATVTEIEKEILINALELNDLVARDLMMPRNDVVTIDRGDTIEQAFQKVCDSQHTRFPVVDGHMDQTRGLIHVKDLIRAYRDPSATLESIMRPLDPVPEKMAADRLLKMFLSRKTHMALVVDEYGGALGIVTLDNVLEELVGDIQDEFDQDEPESTAFQRLSPDEFVVEGSLPLHELAFHTGLELDDPEVSTVGGFVTHLLGHLPEQGEEVAVQNYTVTVTDTDGKKINTLRFQRQEPVQDLEMVGESERLSA